MTPKQNAKWQKSITKMIDSSTPFLDQFFSSNISVLPSIFLSPVNLRMLWWQYGRWHHFLQTQFTSYTPNSDSILQILRTVQLRWFRTPPWYSHLLSGLYHLGNDGCMGFDRVGATSFESGRCCYANLSGEGMSIFGKDIWVVDTWARLD